MTNTPSPDEDRELIERLRAQELFANQQQMLLIGWAADRLESLLSDREQGSGGISGSRQPSPDGLGPSGFEPGRVRDLAECLKQTVGLARAYSHGTGSIFENAMISAERLADRTIADSAITAGTRSAET